MLDRMQRLRRGAVNTVGMATIVVVLASCGGTGPHNGQNALHPAGSAARKIMNLMNPFFWVAVVVGAAVVGMTIFVAVRFRERPGDDRSPVQTHGNIVLEISWTIVPFLILAVMAVPTVATIFNLAKIPKGPNVIHVTVDARQWFWQYEYTDTGTLFYTANEMHIPVHQPVVLTLTSNNVIHSFWVPELSGKKDVVPGHPNTLTIEADRAGTFLGQCAEYCGLSHANMRLRVIAESKADYAAWIRDQQAPLSAAKVTEFNKLAKPWGCTSCHSITSTKKTIGATIGPNLTHVGDRDAFAGDIYPMQLDDLTKWIHDAPGRKPAGQLKGWMPAFSKAGMTTAQAQELAKFLLCETATSPQAHPECR
ncbi:MAG: cytochrome c oxidase subunit [Actinomycetota bacterium]|jgi:cytochrome c oxidase subunit 2|nr:cytochrome c oxidase subunit [Actinomycetota bacterium]